MRITDALLASLSDNDPMLKEIEIDEDVHSTSVTQKLDEIKKLSAAVKTNTTLRVLKFRNYSMTDDAIRAIADALSENQSLRQVCLNSCGINDKNVGELANALKRNDTLRTLDLTGSPMTHTGCYQLEGALAHNFTLRALETSESEEMTYYRKNYINDYLTRNSTYAPLRALMRLQLTGPLSLDEIMEIQADIEGIEKETTDEASFLFTLKNRLLLYRTYMSFEQQTPLPTAEYLVEKYRLLCPLGYSKIGAVKTALLLLLQQTFSDPELERFANQKTSELLLLTDAFDKATTPELRARYQLMAHYAKANPDSLEYRTAMTGLKNPDKPLLVDQVNASNVEGARDVPASIEPAKNVVINMLNLASAIVSPELKELHETFENSFLMRLLFPRLQRTLSALNNLDSTDDWDEIRRLELASFKLANTTLFRFYTKLILFFAGSRRRIPFFNTDRVSAWQSLQKNGLLNEDGVDGLQNFHVISRTSAVHINASLSTLMIFHKNRQLEDTNRKGLMVERGPVFFEAIKRLDQGGVLKHSHAQRCLDAIYAHEYPGCLASTFITMKKEKLLDGDDGLKNITAISQVPTGNMDRAVSTFIIFDRNEPRLLNDHNREHIRSKGRCDVCNAIEALNSGGVLQHDYAQTCLDAIYVHQKPELLASALITLEKKKSSTTARREAVLSTQSQSQSQSQSQAFITPLNTAENLVIFSRCESLHDADEVQIISTAQTTDHCLLDRLGRNGLLSTNKGEKNLRELIANHNRLRELPNVPEKFSQEEWDEIIKGCELSGEKTDHKNANEPVRYILNMRRQEISDPVDFSSSLSDAGFKP